VDPHGSETFAGSEPDPYLEVPDPGQDLKLDVNIYEKHQKRISFGMLTIIRCKIEVFENYGLKYH
jgi:hypothetical protein